MIHNPVYNPTYTVFYKACPMGMRITDLPCYRLTGNVGTGKQSVWSFAEEAVAMRVVRGELTAKAAAEQLGRVYAQVGDKVYRMRKAIERREERKREEG